MKIIAELHLHSDEACYHSRGTLEQYAALAPEKGIKYMASTNHGPMLEDFPVNYFIKNTFKTYEGVNFLAGIEADIRDANGGLDVARCDLLRLDFVIASIHGFSMPGFRDYTLAHIAALDNPAVDCLGHIARFDYVPTDFRRVAEHAAKVGKLIELNDNTVREGEHIEKCERLIDICAEYGTNIVVTGDTHVTEEFALYDTMLELLDKHNFPEELVVNADEDRFVAFLDRRRTEKAAARAALFANLD